MSKFAFSSKIFKAVNKDGKLIIYAKASDNMSDLHGDRFSKKALQMMKQAAKKGLPLRRSHVDAFEIGKSINANLRRSGDRIDYIMQIQLDPSYVEAKKLFDEIENKRSNRQLSIGGTIDFDVANAISYEDTPEGPVRVINNVRLDHVAVTAPEYAANPRTGFVDAVMKSLEVVTPTEKKVVPDKVEDDTETKIITEEEIAEVAKEVVETAIERSVIKAVVPFESYELAAKDAEWSFEAEDGDKLLSVGSGVGSIEEFAGLSEEEQKNGWMLFKSAHTHFDDSEGDLPTKKVDYALPHHKYDDGVLKTYFRGSIAVIAALNGARGGFQQAKSEDERKSLYEHNAKHVVEFGAEAPEFMTDADMANKSIEDFKNIFVDHFAKQNINLDWLFKEDSEEKTVETKTVDKEVEEEVKEETTEEVKDEKKEEITKETSNTITIGLETNGLEKKLDMFVNKLNNMFGKNEESKSIEVDEDPYDIETDITDTISSLHSDICKSNYNFDNLSEDSIILLKEICVCAINKSGVISDCIQKIIKEKDCNMEEDKKEVVAEVTEEVSAKIATEESTEVTEPEVAVAKSNKDVSLILKEMQKLSTNFSALQREIDDMKNASIQSSVIDGQEEFGQKDEGSYKGCFFGK